MPRLSWLRRLPLVRLLAIGEVLVLVREHVTKLDPAERARLIELVRLGRGRRRNLNERERDELAALIAKAEPRAFLGKAAGKLSPIPLSRR